MPVLLPKTKPKKLTHAIVVFLSFDHFWREVIKGSAESLPPRVGSMNAPAEIRNFQLAQMVDQEILGLDISMYHMFIVAVFQRASKGCYVLFKGCF